MSNFKLDVTFTPNQLETLYATGTNVIIGKPSANGAPSDVAWQVFKPLEANTLTWQEKYGIYSSTTRIQNGANLSQLSSVPIPAAMNKLYTLQPSGVISGPAPGGAPNAFALLNRYDGQPFMTEGLYQDATVNGTAIIGNAISAVEVLHQSTATITPFTEIYIWLQSQVRSNSVVTVVTSPMTELKFGGGVNDISVKYDSASGHFINNSSKKMDSELIQHIEVAF